MKRFQEWIRQWLGLRATAAALDSIFCKIDLILADIRRTRETPIPVAPLPVIVAILGSSSFVNASTTWVRDEEHVHIRLDILVPARNPSIFVSTDHSRLEITGIYVGAKLIGSSFPYARYTGTVTPGTIINVILRKVRP